ncbi:aromatic amino acid transport family protein [Salidesulfovibrio onnuriiensis]|uniref:aromatic amino acid transport family protein n=1 Tax=Salidesulfovibrio onnuriiensis TaxID=2583823 RepID=UPI0011C8B83F|nr:aromatic amino acid transport family protein [Salidesulfovibrio onnuriiensis]
MSNSTGGPGTARVVTTAMMVTGNMVGAGILALPINLGPAGLIPAVCGTLLLWLLMTFTAIIYSRQKALVEGENADLPSFFGQVLGPGGKWLSVAANLVILYGLLTAYLAGVASVLINLFKLPVPEWGALVGYFAVAVLLTSFGAVVMRRGNAVLMLAMWGAFLGLIIMTAPHMDGSRMTMDDWGFLPSGLPVLIAAFHFHNLIPTLCRTLDQDRAAITKAIWSGTVLGLLMNLAWIVVVVSALPMEAANGVDILHAYAANQPATVPLARVIGGAGFLQLALVFSLVAMTTSFMANGIALQSFMGDLCSETLGTSSKSVVWPLAFVPPLLVALVYPNIFLSALNLVGGVGINLLFGILPGVLLVKSAGGSSLRRAAGWIMVALFGVILLLELGQESGLLRISPDVEYWTAKCAQ